MRWTVIALLLAASCKPTPAPVDPDIPDVVVGSCSAACERMAALGCEESRPTAGRDRVYGTADDGSCVAICENAVGSGIDGAVLAQCLTQIDSCSDIQACTYGGPP